MTVLCVLYVDECTTEVKEMYVLYLYGRITEIKEIYVFSGDLYITFTVTEDYLDKRLFSCFTQYGLSISWTVVSSHYLENPTNDRLEPDNHSVVLMYPETEDSNPITNCTEGIFCELRCILGGRYD